MKRFLLATVTAAAIVGLYAACSDNTSVAPTTRAPGASPSLNASISSNGEGQCMFLDAVDAGYKQSTLQCTANDVDIGEADVSHYCITDDPVLHPCTPTTVLAQGDRISCTPGQHIIAQVDALIQNSAQERYDMGLWILDPGLSGNANTGTQCRQYNLIPGQNGSVNLDGDQCGDVNSTTTTITVPLDQMDLVCPGNGQTTLSIQACAGWSNSTTGSNDIVCPIDPPGGSEGFRLGTTPPEGSKCTCNSLALPIDVKGVLRIAKVTVPSGSSQSFGFTTTGTGYTTPFSLTDGHTNSSGPLSAGTYTATETVATGWDLTGRTCVNTTDQSTHTFTNITNGISVAVASGEDVTCTFTNTQRPHLTVNKVCNPTSDAGKFNLQIDAATAGTGANAACGGTTGSVEETIGSHSVAETAGTSTSLSDYTTVIGGACAADGSVTLAAGDNKTCTITNTRKPRLTVNKVCNPTSDAGHFNLLVDAATFGTGTNVACGGTTGTVNSTIGAHTVTETAGTSTSLSDYTTVIGGACAADGSVTLAAGDNKTCTVTNTRKGTLTVNKVCDPTSDAGHFNLQIDGTTAGTGANAACGGTTGAQVVTFTTHTVGETAGTSTSLSDYTTVIGGACAADGTVTVSAGDAKVCTITNTRKPRLTVNKVCNPTTDGGHFNLLVDAATFGTGTNVACGGTTGTVNSTIGSHTVTETAAGTTSLGDYTTVIGGACAADGSVTLAAGDNKTCTVTNTRKPTLTVNKVCLPSTDAGLFNLQIDGSTAGTGANAACGGTTGAVELSIGSHTAGETGGTNTSLSSYAAAVFGGDCAADGSVSLAAGQNKTCTITNRRLSTIIIEKEVVGGGTQSFTFTRTLSGGAADGGDNPSPTLQNGGSSSSGAKLVAGNYTVCETNLPVGFADPTATGYTFTTDGLGNFCTTFALGWGDSKTVHVVNTPPPGGGTRTIGYWKNWSSCAGSGGNQYAKAIAAGHPEETLDGNLANVFPIGLITTLTPCQAVNLLSKNAIDGSSRAGDAIYNMVAQLLGAKLNVAAGAGTCSALTTALGQAQTLLVAISFDGTGSYKKGLTKAQLDLATALNTTLTSYNEGTLGGGCPTHV